MLPVAMPATLATEPLEATAVATRSKSGSLERFARRRDRAAARRELKRLHGQKSRPGVDLVRAGAGYSRSFVGAPTSTTCRLKFSDRWVLSRL
jgi:hypothetical protein